MIQLEDSRYSIISCAQRALRQSEISEEAAKDAILALALIGQENFDFLECFIECRVKGVKELLEENSTDSSMLMEELGQHLQYSVRNFLEKKFNKLVCLPLFCAKSSLKIYIQNL